MDKKTKHEKQLAELEQERDQATRTISDLIAAENFSAVPKVERRLADIEREIGYRLERLAQTEREKAEAARKRRIRDLQKGLEAVDAAQEDNNHAALLIHSLWQSLADRGGRGAGTDAGDWTEAREGALLDTFDGMVAEARALLTPLDLTDDVSLEGRFRMLSGELKELHKV